MKNETMARQPGAPRANLATRLLPLAGVAYAALTIAGDLTIGPFPDSGATPTELSTYFAHHSGAVRAGGQLMILGAYCLCLFGVAVWARVRASQGPKVVSGFVLAGTAVGVISELSGAGSYVLLGSIGADHAVGPAALQAVQVGSQVGDGGGPLMLLALFAAGVFSSALPRWLGWSALALAIAALTPFGFFASMLFLLWSAVAGIVLTVRGVGPVSTEAEAPGTAQAALAT
jgi:hypothetical protein